MRRLLLFSVAALALLAAASLAGVARPEAARGDTAPADLVTTNGHGVVTAVPDEATVTAGVRTEAATAEAALGENSAQMRRVVASVKKAGGREVQTQQVSLYPRTDRDGKVTGYVADDSVSAKAQIADAGALVDAAVAAGANTVGGPSLALSDRESLYRDALKKAVADARAKALAIADAGGFGVSRVTTVVEQGAAAQPMFDRTAVAAQAASTPIEPGVQDVVADVTVSFTIR